MNTFFLFLLTIFLTSESPAVPTTSEVSSSFSAYRCRRQRAIVQWRVVCRAINFCLAWDHRWPSRHPLMTMREPPLYLTVAKVVTFSIMTLSCPSNYSARYQSRSYKHETNSATCHASLFRKVKYNANSKAVCEWLMLKCTVSPKLTGISWFWHISPAWGRTTYLNWSNFKNSIILGEGHGINGAKIPPSLRGTGPSLGVLP